LLGSGGHCPTCGYIKTDLGQLRTDLDELENLTLRGFKEQHDHNVDRSQALAQCTAKVRICDETLTGHAVFIDGRVTFVTVAHANCSGQQPGDYHHCPGLDAAMGLACPTALAALDISNANPPLRIGDSVVAYGFGTQARFWSGYVAGNVPGTARGSPWSGTGGGNVTVHPNEMTFQGDQHPGMSGAGVLNGCGYVGMAHATFPAPPHYAIIIPAKEIVDCLRHNIWRLQEAAACPNVQVTQIPRAIICA